MQIQHSDDDLQYLGWNCNSPARQQLQNLCCNQGIHVILLSFQLCKTQIVFLNPLAGSIQKTAECIFHVHSRLMATRTLTSRRNLERELSNILISEAILYLYFLCVKHICRSDHSWRGYLHHQTIIHIIQNITKTSTGRFEHGEFFGTF